MTTSQRNPRYANGHRRRQLRRRVLREERDCFLCGQPVDTALPPGLAGSPEVHEVVPISKGGSPLDRRNCRLTHRLCNEHFGNGDHVQVVRAPLERIVTTRSWSAS